MIALDELRRFPLFKRLMPRRLRRAGGGCCAGRTFPARRVLFRKGDPGETMLLICAGQVRIFLRDEQGNEITFRTLGAGQIIGEFSLLDRQAAFGVGVGAHAAGRAGLAARRFSAPAAASARWSASS